MVQPVEFQEIEIPLGEGPDEKTAELLRAPGVLRSALNVDHRQSGVLRKRRGYEHVDLDNVVNDASDSEDRFCALGTLRGELVVVGTEALYAVGSLDGNLTAEHTSATVTRRGPMIKGGYAVLHVASSNMGNELS